MSRKCRKGESCTPSPPNHVLNSYKTPPLISSLRHETMSAYSLLSRAAQLTASPYRTSQDARTHFFQNMFDTVHQLHLEPFRALDLGIMSKSMELTHDRQTPQCMLHVSVILKNNSANKSKQLSDVSTPGKGHTNRCRVKNQPLYSHR